MAWTAPMTFVASTALTAAQLNTHLRDNMLETAVAKASAAGQFFVATGPNAVTPRTVQMAVVNTPDQTTTDSSYVNLTTPGPSVTVTTGTRAWIFMSMESMSSGVGTSRTCSYKIEGATERDPLETTAIRQDAQDIGSQGLAWGQVDLNTTLEPGVNIFTMMYKSNGVSTATFRNRRIIVWPL